MAKHHYQEAASEEDKKDFAKYLAEDEELVIATGFSSIYLRQQGMLYFIIPGSLFMLLGVGAAFYYKFNPGVGLALGALVAAIIAIGKTVLTYHANRYLLTTRRIIIKKGVFAVKVVSALYDKITHIEAAQGFMDRVLLNHGTIIINTAGANKDEIVLEYIEAPVDFKNVLERLINNERQQYGRHVETATPIEGEFVD